MRRPALSGHGGNDHATEPSCARTNADADPEASEAEPEAVSDWVWVWAYWLLVLIGVLPLSPINRVAAVVVAARVTTQVTYDLGWPEPATQTAIFGLCAIIAMHNARLFTCFLAAALFVPLAIASAWQVSEPRLAWWAVYWLSVTQAIILVANGEWRKAVRHWLKSSSPCGGDTLARLVAFAKNRAWRHA